MASDGIWDYFDNEEVLNISRLVNNREKDMEKKLAKTAEVLLEEAINRGSTDNLSVLVLGLTDPDCSQPQKEQGNKHIKILSSMMPNIKVTAPKKQQKSSKM